MAADTSIRFLVETKDANRKVAALERQVQKLQTAVLQTGGATVKSGAGFKAFGSGAQAAAVGARGFGAALSAALGPLTAVVAAAGSFSQIFSVLSQQDFAEAKVRSLGVNSEDLKAKLKDVSRELSGQASVVELTGAAYDVASAGFNDAADAALILKAASQGATGGFSDINTVGDATTSVLNAYGLEADKAAKLVDGFIQTQNDGKIVIGEYAANIAKVAPVAAALGVPLEEVNAAVAQITAGGQGAEVTFTALKTALAQVAAGKVGKEFEALGVEISASTLKSDGLAGTLEKIKKSGADAGTVIKAFGTEAGPSILALLNNTEKYNELLKNQKEAQGAAAKAAFEASDTINGQLKRLTTAFQNLFSDQSELGVIIKETFKVAAVTVEVFAVGLSNTLAPIRALIAGVGEIGKAVSEALGIKGVDAAFKLEQGFQKNIERARLFSDFVVGLGKRIGAVVGRLASFVVNKGKEVARKLKEIFGGIFEQIGKAINGLYNRLPRFIRKKLDGARSGFSNFISDTIALGQAGAGSSGLGKSDLNVENPLNNISPTGAGGGSGESAKEKADNAERQLRAAEKLKVNADKAKALAIENDEREKIRITRMYELSNIEAKYSDLIKNQVTDQELANLEMAKRLELGNAFIKSAEALEEIQNKERNQSVSRFKKFFEDAAAIDKEIFNKGAKMRELYASIGETISTGIVDSLTAAVEGTKSLAEVASDTLRSLANILLKFGVNSLLGGLGSGGGFLGKLFGGFKADGGTVNSGKSYIVGERGPELFTPGRSGSIAPNSSMSGANVVVNVDASGSKAEGDTQNAKQLGSLIGAAVQAELVKQQRPGGILAS